MPQSSIWGKQAPMDSFIASMDVLQMVERKNPKLIPARPSSIKVIQIIFVEALTLEKCENYEPSNGTTAGQLEDEEDSDKSYSRLVKYNQWPWIL